MTSGLAENLSIPTLMGDPSIRSLDVPINFNQGEIIMASPIFIRIYNYTSNNMTTVVTEHHDLEDDGANFNNKTINARSAYESDTRVKTGGGNGELTITFYEGTAMVGYIKMKDLKNPHKGLDSIEVPMPVNTSSPQFTFVAYRHLDSEPEEERYTYLAINTYPSSSSLP